MVIHSGKPIVQIGRELGVKRSQSACLWGTVAWLIAYSLLTPRPYIPRCHPINPFPLLAQQPSHQAAGFKTVVDPPTWLSEEERRREGVPHRVAREVEPLQLIPLSRPVVARKGRPITQCPMHSVGSHRRVSWSKHKTAVRERLSASATRNRPQTFCSRALFRGISRSLPLIRGGLPAHSVKHSPVTRASRAASFSMCVPGQ